MLDVELVVVYHLVPTSNHNLFPSVITILQLFIILFLHQTTTVMVALMSAICCLSSCSYIKPQLCGFSSHSLCCCLSSCSYIKPQHLVKAHFGISVVYHLVPTSNHNGYEPFGPSLQLFIILFLHQTTTWASRQAHASSLFIILFLHQTTTPYLLLLKLCSCLSSCSYIKPQPSCCKLGQLSVVYHLVPTSNHNLQKCFKRLRIVVYHLVPTSNHNRRYRFGQR